MYANRQLRDFLQNQTPIRIWVGVFLTCFLALQLQFHLTQSDRYPVLDEVVYIRIADNILQNQVISQNSKSTDPTGFHVPAYPIFLAAIGWMDQGFEQSLACMSAPDYPRNHGLCEPDYGSVVQIQLLLGALTLTLSVYAGQLLLGSKKAGFLAAMLILITGRYAEYANQLLTENLIFPILSLASVMLLLAWRNPRPITFAVLAACFAMATLTRPSFAYLAYISLPLACLAILFVRNRNIQSRMLVGVVISTILFSLAVAPWLYRNQQQFGKAFLTEGYAPYILAQRLSYNRMTAEEFAVSFVFWLPGPGEYIAQKWFPEDSYQRLTFDHPNSYFLEGGSVFLDESLAAAGSRENHLKYLIENHMVGDLGSYLLSSAALTYRGIWIVKYWSLIAVPSFLILLGNAVISRRNRDFLIFSFPPLFMLMFHALVSVNVHRYNLILLPPLAVASIWMGWFTLQKIGNWTGSPWPGKVSGWFGPTQDAG